MTDSKASIKKIMREAKTVSNKATLKEVLVFMFAEKTNTVYVVDDNNKLEGEISVVDLVKGVVPDYVSSDAIAARFISEEAFENAVVEAKDKCVTEFMVRNKKAVRETGSLMEAAIIAMHDGQARMPVVDNEGKVVGIITRRGLKCILAEALGVDCSFDY